MANLEKNRQEQQQPSGTGKQSRRKWAKSFWKWTFFALSVLGVAALIALLACHPALFSWLALAVAIARGIVMMLPNGRYKHSATHEDIQVDDIPSKHPELMESLLQNLNTAQKIINTVVA
ncbi:protein ROOT HAIR DEFECTIVE 3 2-like isoform X2 [Salvia divinorum]|uniref:Protein ROOT HAIR DEFECTIVE 3 2-like isoform X2 n=1 Tax=Salvia divinorum TaxID=28513 RepID=A0ABD1G3X4_SALDI